MDTWMLSTLLRGQQGCVSAAAEAGARLVMVDGALVRADVAAGEIGLDMGWRVSAESAAVDFIFEDVGGLPWPVAHLRRSGDGLTWVRRGADVAESWTFPEAPNEGRFAVETDTGSGFGGRVDVAVPSAVLEPDVLAARVAEVGADGRSGPWVSIGSGTS